MVIRRNAKKFAAFALAISFFSSVGHGEALIKKKEQAQVQAQTRAQIQNNIIRMNTFPAVPMMMLVRHLELGTVHLDLTPINPNMPLHALPSQEQFSPNFSQRQLFDALLSQDQLLESLTDVCFKKSGKK